MRNFSALWLASILCGEVAMAEMARPNHSRSPLLGFRTGSNSLRMNTSTELSKLQFCTPGYVTKQPYGTRCKTTSGRILRHHFEGKFGVSGVLDEKSGMFWADLKTNVRFPDEARALCSRRGLVIPDSGLIFSQAQDALKDGTLNALGIRTDMHFWVPESVPGIEKVFWPGRLKDWQDEASIDRTQSLSSQETNAGGALPVNVICVSDQLHKKILRLGGSLADGFYYLVMLIPPLA